MAWENFILDGLEDIMGTVNDLSLFNGVSQSVANNFDSSMNKVSYKFINPNSYSQGYLIGNNQCGIYLRLVSGNEFRARGDLNGSTAITDTYQFSYKGLTNNHFTLFCGVDHETQKATLFTIFSASGYPYMAYMLVNTSAWVNSSVLYNIVTQFTPIPPYNWQSVPSISGKGKTVNLSTLNDINDGEEVITDDTSKFNLTTASNLATLVQN